MKRKLTFWFLIIAVLANLVIASAATPVPKNVVISPQNLTVDGNFVNVQKYNIDGSNYFKLRDIAYLLADTDSEFSVGWDADAATVSIATNDIYTPVGNELTVGADLSYSAVPSPQTILVDGCLYDDLYVYNIGGENFFKLRDLGEALCFDVDFDAETNTASIMTFWYPWLDPEPDPYDEPDPYTEPVPEPYTEDAGDEKLTVAGKTYCLGMTVTELTALAGNPADTVLSTAGFNWMIFGTDSYLDFLIAGVSDGKVVALASGGKAFSYMGNKAGAQGVYANSNAAKLYTDDNDNGILHAVLLTDRSYLYGGNVTSIDALRGESVVNFHMTNAFRVYHGLTPFIWSEACAEAARLHSIDMAEQDYFSHIGLDGRSPVDRMHAQGISFQNAAENITSGSDLGIDAYDEWVNSAGHRNNMLGECVNLGVGAGYNGSSTYGWYMTQDFFTE